MRKIRLPVTFVFIIAATLAGFLCGMYVAYQNRETTLAMEWGDGRYGQAFYGAKITLEPEATGYAVRGDVLISPDSLGDVSYRHDCGVIGHVKDYSEATRKFGVVVWKTDGLHVGPYFLPREQFENHR